MRDGPAFETSRLRFAYPRSLHAALDALDLEVPPRRWTAVVGPNGAGKSTLLRILSGVLRPAAGVARFRGRPLDRWDRRELARAVAVVAQEPPPAVPLTVRELVELGRNPYVSPWGPLGREDRRAVDGALDRCELLELAGRGIEELSGGERQRAKLARGLAQEPEVLLIDEPTAHLDPGHAVWFFELLRALRDERGVTIVTATHDLNLASRYADGLVLLDGGRVAEVGDPGDVLRPEALTRAYQWPMHVEDLGSAGRVVVPLAPAPASPRTSDDPRAAAGARRTAGPDERP